MLLNSRLRSCLTASGGRRRPGRRASPLRMMLGTLLAGATRAINSATELISGSESLVFSWTALERAMALRLSAVSSDRSLGFWVSSIAGIERSEEGNSWQTGERQKGSMDGRLVQQSTYASVWTG